jgi:hypothetical protein
VASFNALMRRQLASLRAQPGLVYVKVARRMLADGGEEAILFEEWVDADSLYAWVGPRLTEPRLVPGAREMTDAILVTHYELLAEAADERSEASGAGKGSAAAEAAEGTVPGG